MTYEYLVEACKTDYDVSGETHKIRRRSVAANGHDRANNVTIADLCRPLSAKVMPLHGGVDLSAQRRGGGNLARRKKSACKISGNV